MGTTYITLKHLADEESGKDGQAGFWMNDSILEIWLRFLALHVEDPSPKDEEQSSTARRIRDQWLLASRGYFGGWIPHNLSEAVKTQIGFTIVKNAVLSLSASLEKSPEKLSSSTLNLLGISNGVFDDIETARLREIAKAFLDLLDGQITSGNIDGGFMPGSKN